MASKFKITTIKGAPISRPIVNTHSKLFPGTSNPQLSSPPWPICLYDQVTVAAAGGGNQAFRNDAFTNNTGRPIEMHAMRVVITLTPTSPNVKGGGVVALQMAANGVPMTRGAVPVWSMCRSDNRLNDTFAGLASITTYCWYFSQPLPLRPGEGISVQAQHLGAPATVAATVGLSFSGRVSPRPIPNRVPFASSWTSKAFGYSEVGTDQSPPTSIANDTGRDLVVDRIIGRPVAYDDGSLGAGTFSFRDFSDVSLQGVSSMYTRLSLSRGRPILRTYTPMRTVFSQNGAVETDFIMKDGDYMTVGVSHLAGPTLNTPFTFSQNYATISIVGWREI